ncbi:MAG TPA: ubiquinol-cytochrome c reductase iron-sulfur subunit [Acidimicrobiales bacterium]|nr:ubiquinol-cytochrome c reductase iron-sulfur subunit [Acidimicrobiales bacterium]
MIIGNSLMPEDTDGGVGTGVPDEGSHRVTIPVTSVSVDAPQFKIAAKNPRRAEMLAGAAFLLGAAAFAGFGAAYWQNYSNFWLGTTLGLGFAGAGAGMVVWGKYLMPRGPFSEARHSLVSTEAQREVFIEDFASRGKVAIERRGFLVKALGLASGILGVVLAFPLIRSLGPLPKKSLYKTAWRSGSYLVDITGRKIKAGDLEIGGFVTVFPETDIGGAYSQTMLIRVDPPSASGYMTPPARFQPERDTWAPQGYIAFSKVCTHAGCPVGLYEELTKQMLCPCHQSLFIVSDAATPIFGPAPRPLPQLPLYIDHAGYFRAQDGYNEPVGPGFWERGND